MWEIGEGDIKIFHVVKLMPPKDLRSIVHLGNIIENIFYNITIH